jgi:hypothetical protein
MPLAFAAALLGSFGATGFVGTTVAPTMLEMLRSVAAR